MQVKRLYSHMHYALICAVLYLAIPLPLFDISNTNGMLVEEVLDAKQNVLETLVLLIEDDDADLRVAPRGVGEELLDGIQERFRTMPYLALCDVCDMIAEW